MTRYGGRRPARAGAGRAAGRAAGGRAAGRAVGVADRRNDLIGQVLARHREGVDGWCRGCAQEGILAFHPCPSASWAGEATARLPLSPTPGSQP